MDLINLAKETAEIVERGWYDLHGKRVNIESLIAVSVQGTRLYRPKDKFELFSSNFKTIIEVTGETTIEAAHRLINEGESNVAALNFASAKNPGGGWLRGAKAQEEDLARSSVLYTCLMAQPDFYLENKKCQNALYTDHLIYSPNVPFFRNHTLSLCEPYLVSILTSPAPNAGEARKTITEKVILETLQRRAAQILSAALRHHRVLILGAWGCGVFQNNPKDVADIFSQLLSSSFDGKFSRVVFAIYDRSTAQDNLKVFQEVFKSTK